MELTIAPNGVLQIDDARLTYRNFAGVGGPFNKEGERNFHLIIPTLEMAEALKAEGWNVKIKPARDEYEEPFITLKVKVVFNDFGPNVYLRSGNAGNKLNEDSIGVLDRARFTKVDLDIRPYDWEMNGKTGRTAYLQSLDAEQAVYDRFAERYAD